MNMTSFEPKKFTLPGFQYTFRPTPASLTHFKKPKYRGLSIGKAGGTHGSSRSGVFPARNNFSRIAADTVIFPPVEREANKGY